VLPAAAAEAAKGDWTFALRTAVDLQARLFGSAARQGWLGGDHGASFRLHGKRYLWIFGDTLTNSSTAASSNPEEGESAGCNYFASRRCAMPTNTFATWDGSTSDSSLEFHMQYDRRSGEPTSFLWPPGWGGSGRTPKTPACNSCSLWKHPTVLHQTEEQCLASGAKGVQRDKGACCSTVSSACPGYCCHDELYFRPMAGMTNAAGDRVLIMTNMGKESAVMPNQGWSYGTYAVSIRTGGQQSPRQWEYSSARMPGTQVWPWTNWSTSKQFYSAMAEAREPEQPDLIYLLGMMGRSRILARANLSDVLDFRWERMQFLAAGRHWRYYAEGTDIPEVESLWSSRPSGVSLHFDPRLGMWLTPEVDSETKIIVFRVSASVTGPYKAWIVGRLPSDIVHSDLNRWDVRSVKNHPELVSSKCLWVLSIIFYWRSSDAPPPSPGLHYFPRLICVTGNYTHHGKIVTPKPLSAEMMTPAPPAVNPCDPRELKKLEDTLACSDLGDGCHTCRQRAEWIVKHNSRSLREAYGIVAEEFPQGCGGILQCKEHLLANAQQAWEAQGVAAAAGERSSLAVASALASLLAAGGLVVAVWRQRDRGSRSMSASAAEEVFDEAPGALEAAGALLST